MKKRKICCMMLAVLLIFSMVLCGCGKKKNRPTEPNDSKPTSSAPVDPSGTHSDPVPDPSIPDTGIPGDDNLSLGYLQDDYYINPYIGFKLKLDDFWEYSTAEELQSLPEEAGKVLSGSELAEILDEYPQIFALNAANTRTQTGINGVYTKLSSEEQLTYMYMTQEQIVDSVLQYKDTMIDAYEHSGIQVHSMEKVAVTFLGQNSYAIHLCGEINGVAYYALQLVFQQTGSYAVTFTLASFQTDQTEELLALFTEI